MAKLDPFKDSKVSVERAKVVDVDGDIPVTKKRYRKLIILVYASILVYVIANYGPRVNAIVNLVLANILNSLEKKKKTNDTITNYRRVLEYLQLLDEVLRFGSEQPRSQRPMILDYIIQILRRDRYLP